MSKKDGDNPIQVMHTTQFEGSVINGGAFAVVLVEVSGETSDHLVLPDQTKVQDFFR